MKTKDHVHVGFQAIMMPSNMKQEVNNGLIKAEETTEALTETGNIQWGYTSIRLLRSLFLEFLFS